MSKKSFVLYDSWGELITNLPDDMAGALIKSVISYAIDGEERDTDDPAIKAMFAMIKAKLDEDAAAYEEAIKQRSEAGKKAMAKRWGNNATKDNGVITKDNGVITDDNGVKQSVTKITVSESVSVSESESVSENENVNVSPTEKKKRGRTPFTPPSVDEVRAYCLERGNNVDPETFVDFYSSKGWRVGNNPMKDWRASVRTWEKRDRAAPPRSSPGMDANEYLESIITGGGL